MNDLDYFKFYERITFDDFGGGHSGRYKCKECGWGFWNVSDGKLDFPLKLHIDIFHPKLIEGGES